jgi:hypothetical protein
MQWWQQQHQQHQCEHQCEPHAQQEQGQRQQGFAADYQPGLRHISVPPALSCAAAATPPAGSGGDAIFVAAAADDDDDDDDHSFPGGDLDDFDLMMAEMTGQQDRVPNANAPLLYVVHHKMFICTADIRWNHLSSAGMMIADHAMKK